jgi:hypothetical protein
MNERFRELAQLAVADAAKYCQRPFDLSREENETFAMSFAELIVRECVDIVSKVPNGYRDYRNQIEDAMRADCLQAIQEHFGVE